MADYKKNTIIWQKWFDPFGHDEEFLSSWPDAKDEDEEEDVDIEKKHLDAPINQSNNIRAIATPMGIIPYTENTASSKIFNFWIGHTNFSITKNLAHIIENIEGVETLDIFTRYRFRIAIGKAFNPGAVMSHINDVVQEYLE